MQLFKWAAVVVVAAAAAFFVLPAAPAAADDDIDVSPLDEDASAESLRESGESGFDTAGSFYIGEDDYNAGTPEDGTWDPDVPDPEASEYDDDGN